MTAVYLNSYCNVLIASVYNFLLQLNKRVCGLLKIKRSLCSPYHPQTNGLVEKMNGTIQRALCKVVGNQPQMWDEYLDAVMFGLRTKKQVTTKYSPYYLMFGREARYPSEIPEEFMVCLFVCDKLHGNPTQRNFFSF